MKNKPVFEISRNDISFGVRLEQTGKDSFTVIYGKQVKRHLSYSDAAHEFGLCLFHALACDGKLDNAELKHGANKTKL